YSPEARDAIRMMSEMANAFSDDYITQKLIYKWIEDEKEHVAWMAQYLNYIDKLGYENFLTAMM
ncbi:MAG: hypothetical protein IJP74_13350, partial [Prevotella sp.]|nr:hypothetical protein [Prevotella sp.]